MTQKERLAEAIAENPTPFMQVVEKHQADLSAPGALEEAIAPYGIDVRRDDAVAVVREINTALARDSQDLSDEQLEGVSGGIFGAFVKSWTKNIKNNDGFQGSRDWEWQIGI